MPTAPRISALLIVPYGYKEILTTFNHLRAQSVVGQIQVVFVVPAGFDEPLPAGCEAFHSVVTALADPMEATGACWAVPTCLICRLLEPTDEGEPYAGNFNQSARGPGRICDLESPAE